MIILRRIIWILTVCCLVSLPFQTQLILAQKTIGMPPGDWQYGVLGIRLLDCGIIFLAAMCLVYALIVWKKNTWQLRIPRFTVWQLSLAIFLCLTVLSLREAGQEAVALLAGARLMEGVFFFFVLSRSWISETAILFSIAGAGCIQAGLAMYQMFTQEVFASSLLGMAFHAGRVLGDSVVEFGDERWLRAYGSFPHPNMLGGFLGISLIGLCVLLNRSSKKHQILATIFAGNTLLVALFFSYSRGAWLALVAALMTAIFFVLRKPVPRKESGVPSIIIAIVTGVCTLGVLGVLFWGPLSTRLGIGGWSRLEVRSLSERSVSFRTSLVDIEKNPRGVGMGQSTWSHYLADRSRNEPHPSYEYQPVHSLYLLIASEVGIIGGLFFLIFIGTIGWRVFRYAMNSGALSYTPALFIFLVVCALFDHSFWSLPGGVLVWWVGMGIVARVASRDIVNQE